MRSILALLGFCLAALDLKAQDTSAPKLEKAWSSETTFVVTCVAFSPDGKSLAAGGREYGLILIDSASGQIRKTFPVPKTSGKEDITGVGFSADGNFLLTGGSDGAVRQWDVRSGKEVKAKVLMPFTPTSPSEEMGIVNRFEVSSDGKLCAAGFLQKIAIVKGASIEETLRLAGHPCAVTASTRAWGIHALFFSRDNSKLASGGPEGIVRVWDVKTGKQLHALQSRTQLPDRNIPVYVVSLSGDGKFLATPGDNGAVRIWDIQTGKEQPSLAGHKSQVKGLAFSSPGRHLISADQDVIKIWDHSAAKELFEAPTPDGVDCMVLSRDGGLLALGSYRKSVSVFRWTGPKTATEEKK